MEKLVDILNKIKKEEYASITRFAEMDEKNKNFKDCEYFTIEKNNMFFYIQKTTITDWTNGIGGNYSITAYKKINYNLKQQLSYPKGFNTYKELKNIIEKMSKELPTNETLPKTYKQNINYELKKIYRTKYGELTLINYLSKIAGFREKEILKNIDKITMNINNENYLVFEFYNKNGQSFAINANNIDRLIIS
jgi:hypothetical protein